MGEVIYSSTRCNFNSHARVGRDQADEFVKFSDLHFNSHARVGRDLNE